MKSPTVIRHVRTLCKTPHRATSPLVMTSNLADHSWSQNFRSLFLLCHLFPVTYCSHLQSAPNSVWQKNSSSLVSKIKQSQHSQWISTNSWLKKNLSYGWHFSLLQVQVDFSNDTNSNVVHILIPSDYSSWEIIRQGVQEQISHQGINACCEPRQPTASISQ